jgi:AhpD family alkylhydroperoxidase
MDEACHNGLRDRPVDGRCLPRAVQRGTGTHHQLTASGFGLTGDFGDRFVRVLEDLTQYEDNSLFRLQVFHKVQKADRQARPSNGILFRGRSFEDRFRKPFAGINFPPMLRGTKLIDGEPGHDRCQPGLSIPNRGAIRLFQAEQSLLHNIFALNETSEIPVGERQEACAFGARRANAVCFLRFMKIDGTHEFSVQKARLAVTIAGAISSRNIEEENDMTDKKTHKVESRIDLTDHAFSGVLKAMFGLEEPLRKSGLEPALRDLMKVRASQMNGCAYCIDMHTKDARVHGETEQRLYALNAWRETPFYTDRERAALEWTEHLTLIAGKDVPNELYARMREHFSVEEIVSLALAVVQINGWNRLAMSFRAPAGTYQPAQSQTTTVTASA